MSAKTAITNQNIEGSVTLPPPYKGMLGPGASAIVTGLKSTVAANCGGGGSGLRFTTVADSTPATHDGPFQASAPVSDADVATKKYVDDAEGGDATTSLVAQRYLQALTVPTVHLRINTSLVALAALAGVGTQVVTDTRAEAIRTAWAAHLANAFSGTLTAGIVDGDHKAADTALRATLVAIPAATEINSCIVLVNGLLVALADHGDSAGVHFANDAAAAGATITADPPVTLANLRDDLDELLAAMKTHMALGST